MPKITDKLHGHLATNKAYREWFHRHVKQNLGFCSEIIGRGLVSGKDNVNAAEEKKLWNYYCKTELTDTNNKDGVAKKVATIDRSMDIDQIVGNFYKTLETSNTPKSKRNLQKLIVKIEKNADLFGNKKILKSVIAFLTEEKDKKIEKEPKDRLEERVKEVCLILKSAITA